MKPHHRSNHHSRKGSAFIIALIVIAVVSIWIATLNELTKASVFSENRQETLLEVIATADAGAERAWGRWRERVKDSSSLPTQDDLTEDWDDKAKAPDWDLNDVVKLEPENVNIYRVDGVGRIIEADEIGLALSRFDTSRRIYKRSVTYLASATASSDSAFLGPEMDMTVNRVFSRSDIPLFQYLAFFDHTLTLHAGPPMYLDGRLHSNKKIIAMAVNETVLGANVSTPVNNPPKVDGNGDALSDDVIRDGLEAMIDAGNEDEIRGFFEDEQVDGLFGLSQGGDVRFDDDYGHIQLQEELRLFDPNDSDYKQFWEDNDNNGVIDWQESSDPNVNGGYREIIEKPDPNSNDSLFIAQKRFYNQANLVIEIDSENAIQTNPVSGDVEIVLEGNVNIYWKDLNLAIPSVPPGSSNAQKQAAIDAISNKEEVPATSYDGGVPGSGVHDVTELAKALIDTDGPDGTADEGAISLNSEALYDQWMEMQGNPNSGTMDVIDVDMEVLKEIMDSWASGDVVYKQNGETVTPPKGGDGPVLYITDPSSDPANNTVNKGLRLFNGAQLPEGGLTVATDLLAYVQGDYNTGSQGSSVDTNRKTTKFPEDGDVPYDKSLDYRPEDHPSALIADTIRLLSNNWEDDNSSNSTSNRKASNTTFNLAMVMGDRFTNEFETDTGGLHNFPRFLESWKNKEATIRGAFIQLWQSDYIRAAYDCCPAYDPPNRHWGFQQSFIRNPPPGSLDAIEYTRGRYWISAEPPVPLAALNAQSEPE